MENLDKLQPALSNRALQPIGLASRRSLSASGAIGYSDDGGVAWLSTSIQRQGDRVIEVKPNEAGQYESGQHEWTLYDGESFHYYGSESDESEQE